MKFSKLYFFFLFIACSVLQIFGADKVIVANKLSYTVDSEPSGGNPGTCYLNSDNKNIKLENIVIPNSVFDNNNEYLVTQIKASAFENNQSIKTVDLSQCQNLRTIGNMAFQGCTSLESVNMTNCINLVQFGTSSFANCTSLINIDFTNCIALTNISNIFKECISLKVIDLSDCIKLYEIGSNAFINCRSLETVYFPDAQFMIYTATIFDGCTNLNTLVIYSPTPPNLYGSIPYFPAGWQPITTLYVPAEAVDTYKANSIYTTYFIEVLPLDEMPGLQKPIQEIELNITDFSITIGADPIEIEASITPSDATDVDILWSAEPQNIAEIIPDENNPLKITINPLTEGECILKATSPADESVTASCKINVQKLNSISVTAGDGTNNGNSESGLAENTTQGGSLLGNNLTLRVGQSAGLSVTTAPISDYSPLPEWNLENNNIASLNVSPDNPGDATFIGLEIGKTNYTLSIPGYDELTLTGEINVIAENPISSITMSLDGVSLPLNSEAYKIEYVISPSDASLTKLEWKSDNDKVATVDETGTITPIGTGSCTITATTLDGTGISVSFTVTITQAIAENIEFELEEYFGGAEGITLEIGETYQFTVKPTDPESVLPENITWTSGDEDVALIDQEGNLTAIGVGESIITASANVNGKTVNAECQVTVIPVTVKTLTLSQTTANMIEGSTLELSVNYSPDTAEPVLNWSTSDNTVLMLRKGEQETYIIVEALKPGTATVTVTSSNSDNLSATCEINVSENKTNSIDALFGDSDTPIDVYDINGRIILQGVAYDVIRDKKLRPGIYIIRQGNVSKKITIR